jgi:hypothetical protein
MVETFNDSEIEFIFAEHARETLGTLRLDLAEVHANPPPFSHTARDLR